MNSNGKICNYSTKIKGQLARHNGSKKHHNNMIAHEEKLKETHHIIHGKMKKILSMK